MALKREFKLFFFFFLFSALGSSAVADGKLEDRLRVGLNAFQDGFYSLAAKELWVYVDGVPDDSIRSEVLYVLAQAEIAQKRWVQAEKALRTLSSSGTAMNFDDIGYLLGWVLSQEGRKKEALNELIKALEEPQSSRYADAVYLAAEISRDLGDHGQTAKYFALFINSAQGDSRTVSVWPLLIEAHVQAGNFSMAKESALKALLDKAVAATPGIFETAALQGIKAARKSSDEKTESVIWGYLTEGKGGPALAERAHFEKGAALHRAGDNAAAKKTLSNYVEKFPDGAHVANSLLLLVEIAKGEKDDRAALAHVETALALNNNQQIRKKRSELLQTAFSLALSLKEGKKAVARAKELLTGGGSLSPEMKGLVHNTLGVAEFESGDVDAAVSHFDSIPKESGLSSEAKITAASILIKYGRAKEALRRLEPMLKNENINGDLLIMALKAAEESGNKKLSAELGVRVVERRLVGEGADELLYRAAGFQRELNNEKEAYEILKMLAMQFTNSPYSPIAAFELQKKAFNDKNWETVILWSSVAKNQKESTSAAYLEAEALFKQNRVQEAMEAYSVLAEASGEYKGTALARLGSLLEKQGRGAEALATYKKAVEAGLKGEMAGWVQNRLGLFEKAQKNETAK